MFSRKTSEKTLHHCPLKGQKHSTMKPWWWVGIARNFSQGFMMAQIPGGRIYCLLTAEGHNVDRKIVTPCLPSFKKLYNCSWGVVPQCSEIRMKSFPVNWNTPKLNCKGHQLCLSNWCLQKISMHILSQILCLPFVWLFKAQTVNISKSLVVIKKHR